MIKGHIYTFNSVMAYTALLALMCFGYEREIGYLEITSIILPVREYHST
jgi:hypothetical protein